MSDVNAIQLEIDLKTLETMYKRYHPFNHYKGNTTVDNSLESALFLARDNITDALEHLSNASKFMRIKEEM